MLRGFVVLVSVVLVSTGCHEGNPPPSDGGGRPQPPLVLGGYQPLYDLVLPAAGGDVTVTDGPLAGLTLTVPPGAWPQDVKLSVGLTPITEVRLDGVTAGSGLIRFLVDGPAVAAEPVHVFIPGELSDDAFAMVFGYDADTFELEAMPSYPAPGGTGFVTQHFSDYATLRTQRVRLDAELRTPFVFGVDTFPLVNEGSYLAPGGFCSGDVVSTITYFADRRLDGGRPLVEVADERPPDGGASTITSQTFYSDDRRAWQLASAVQNESVFSLEHRAAWHTTEQRADPSLAAQLMSAALFVTRQPQMLSIRRFYEDGGSGGHALLCFGRENVDGGVRFLIADPNYPWRPDAGTPREVRYAADAGFAPYSGKRNAEDATGQYTELTFVGTWAFVSREAVRQRWDDFDADRLGDGFPGAPLVAKASTVAGNPQAVLADGLVRTDPELRVGLDPESYHWRIRIYDAAFRELANGNKTLGDWVSVTLHPGDNLLGIRVDGRSGTAVPNFRWVDFRWVTVRYQAPEPGQPVVLGRVTLPDRALGLTVKGTTAYVALDTAGVAVVDVSNAAAPDLVSVADVGAHSTGRGLVVSDDGYAFAGVGSFKILDVADPLHVTAVSGTGFNANCGRLEVRGTSAFVACGTKTYVSEGLLGIADVSDAGSGATNRGIGAITWSRTVRDVALSPDGQVAYLLGSGGSVATFDVSDPRAPGTTALATLSGDAVTPWALDREGGLLFVAADGLRVADVSVPAAPAWLGGDPYRDVRDVDAFGTSAVAVGVVDSAGRLWLYDVSDPYQLAVTKTLTLASPATAVQVVGNRAYVTTATSTGAGELLVVGF